MEGGKKVHTVLCPPHIPLPPSHTNDENLKTSPSFSEKNGSQSVQAAVQSFGPDLESSLPSTSCVNQNKELSFSQAQFVHL